MGAFDKDLEHLNAVSQGSEEALELLMNRHKQAVFHFAYRYLDNEDDAAEITENTFFRVYQKAHTFKPKGTVKTWIFTIALNLTRDHLRKNKKRTGHTSLHAQTTTRDGATTFPVDTIDSGEKNPADSLRSSDAVEEIENTIRELPEKLRFPFVFCILEKHSYDDCAEVLGKNRKTVEMRIYRARKVLQNKLAGYFTFS